MAVMNLIWLCWKEIAKGFFIIPKKNQTNFFCLCDKSSLNITFPLPAVSFLLNPFYLCSNATNQSLFSYSKTVGVLLQWL